MTLDRSLERQNVVLDGHHLWLPFPSCPCVLVSKVNEPAGRKRKSTIITLRLTNHLNPHLWVAGKLGAESWGC